MAVVSVVLNGKALHPPPLDASGNWLEALAFNGGCTKRPAGVTRITITASAASAAGEGSSDDTSRTVTVDLTARQCSSAPSARAAWYDQRGGKDPDLALFRHRRSTSRRRSASPERTKYNATAGSSGPTGHHHARLGAVSALDSYSVTAALCSFKGQQHRQP